MFVDFSLPILFHSNHSPTVHIPIMPDDDGGAICHRSETSPTTIHNPGFPVHGAENTLESAMRRSLDRAAQTSVDLSRAIDHHLHFSEPQRLRSWGFVDSRGGKLRGLIL